jgi:hypothetical protein
MSILQEVCVGLGHCSIWGVLFDGGSRAQPSILEV